MQSSMTMGSLLRNSSQYIVSSFVDRLRNSPIRNTLPTSNAQSAGTIARPFSNASKTEAADLDCSSRKHHATVTDASRTNVAALCSEAAAFIDECTIGDSSECAPAFFAVFLKFLDHCLRIGRRKADGNQMCGRAASAGDYNRLSALNRIEQLREVRFRFV